jgi:YD repeat-containing protein
VVAEDARPLGVGWTLSNTSQLFQIAASGTGGYRFYTSSGSGFTSPAGDNGTLSVNGSGLEYAAPDGEVTQFNSNGMEIYWTSPDGQEVLSYRYDGSNRRIGTTAIDGAQATFDYGTYTSIQRPQRRRSRMQ